MSLSTNLSLPYLQAAQAQKHVTHNEALKILDAVVQLTVLDRDLTTPPSSPVEGDRYIIAPSATGAWASADNNIAAFQDGVWTFYAPQEGWLAWITDEDELTVWDGSAWSNVTSASPISINPASLVGVNATADTSNRLSVSSPATLFNHEGTSHRVKINKAAGADTASVLFQTGFSGRAEFGLTGDDNFHMKVSPDGTNFKDALILNAVTGEYGSPYSPSAHPNILINGDFQINQRQFTGGTLSAGSFGHDRWRAGPGGATYSLSGYVISLSSGSIEQVVEATLWGQTDFNANYISISLENLTADVTVDFAGSSGTITAGSGRRSYTFSPGTSTSPTPTVSLSSTSGVSFSRVKIELAPFASAWSPRPNSQEKILAARYFQRVTKANPGSGTQLISNGVANSGSFLGTLSLANLLRAEPTLSVSALTDFALEIPGVATTTPTDITLEHGDGDNALGAHQLTLACSYSGASSGAAFLKTATSQTAIITLDAEL